MKKASISILFFCCCCLAKAQTNEFTIFNTANTPAFTGNNFKCIAIGDSVIFAGTQYQGLYKYDTSYKVWIKSIHLTNVFINDIKRDRNGGIWIAQSGTSGLVGNASNNAGGINYFPDQYDAFMQFYSVPGTTTNGGLVSRNVRSIYVDTTAATVGSPLPRVWGVMNTYITSGSTTAGGINIGLNANPLYFSKRTFGLQVFPYVISPFNQGTPSCDAVHGNHEEVWVSVRLNFGMSQILRYNPTKNNLDEAFLGSYNYTNVGGNIFTQGFRAQAIFFDSEGRKWVGLQFDGMRVLDKSVWHKVNMPDAFPLGTQINNNAITEDDRGNIYIGTSTGLVVFDGGGEVTDSSHYTRLTTADGLPSNNITGLAYDKAKGRMLIATDAGIAFWTVKNKIEVNMEWDYSFPTREGKLKGVAADGVSRMYLVIKNGDTTLPDITSVNISLHEYTAADSSIRGRLKVATVLDKYSEEASTGTATDITINTAAKPKEFWAWYVAPNDFSMDANGPDADKSVRTEKIRIIVSYANNSKDTLVYDKLKIVRPPLLMVHGLASGPPTWYDFRHNDSIYFKNSPRFKYAHMLTMNGRAAFIKNAKLLMAGDALAADPNKDTAQDRTNTLQGNLEQMRGMGYAANQVDYVCHSMGGIMIRHAIDRMAYKFYAGEGSGRRYFNYNRGFTHKIVFVNTPHNSSILGDGVDEFIPQAPEWLNAIMRTGYLVDRMRQIPYDFIQPTNPNNLLTTTFKASDAVNNLQVSDARGGINLAETKAKFHMITGNVNLLSVQTTTMLAEMDPVIEYCNNIIKCMLNSRLVPLTIKKAVLEPMLAVGNVTRMLTFFEWYSRNLGYPDYLAESDLIVPLASEHARIPLPGAKPYITMFNNSPGSAFDASHVTILKRPDVGQRVMDLLNSKVYGPLFGDVIPANNDPEPNPVLQARPMLALPKTTETILNTDSIYYDSTRIKIDFPAKGIEVFADSTVAVKFRVKNTTDLAYVNLVFQYTDTFSLSKTTAQQTMPVKIRPELGGRQTLWAVAAYYRPDNGMKYYIDTFNLLVKNNAPLQGFRVNSDRPLTIYGGEYYFPPYQLQYNSKWVNHPAADTAVAVSFNPPGIITRIDSIGGFTVLNEGDAVGIFTYNGFSDTLLIKTIMPLDSFCINKTIAAGSFKNPAIWSKGVVPGLCDSIVVQHAVNADTSIIIKAARINPGATLTLNNASINLQIGETGEGTAMLENAGTLTIQSGTISVKGRVLHKSGSTFNMSGGNLKIDGNAGVQDISVSNGLSLFEASPGMLGFNFTGGILELADPPFGDASQAINCAYNFGDNSTLVLGVNTSATPGKNPDGFGGSNFPAKIGKLIINAGTRNGNRHFINKKTLTVKGSVEVGTGSGLILQAPLQVNK
ncbi:MAG TPA: hypothetical protein PKC39_06790 [Ferruginibacter sp.]|nr:hypothetical protein [Ferruginibacter sp.]HMP20646.1 hypothetical protein [Ferruginibacter sp.]